MMDGWTPSIGDPTPIGWITVLAYVVAAVMCLRAASLPKPADMRFRQRHGLWCALGIVMIALGINKQLDLQSLFTAIGRDVANRRGWYDGRRRIQEVFILMVAISGAATISLTAIHLRRDGWAVRLAGAGLAFLIVFIIVRAASFHHMDVLLRTAFIGLRLNALLELGGIAAITVGAFGYRVQIVGTRELTNSPSL